MSSDAQVMPSMRVSFSLEYGLESGSCSHPVRGSFGFSWLSELPEGYSFRALLRPHRPKSTYEPVTAVNEPPGGGLPRT